MPRPGTEKGDRLADSVIVAADDNVVEVREDENTAVEASTRRGKRVVLRERKKRWHESIALLPALALMISWVVPASSVQRNLDC